MAKREKVIKFSIQTYDAAHYKQTEAYTKAIEALFDKATAEISRLAANGQYNPNKPFSFSDYPSIQKTSQQIIQDLTKRITTTIEAGSKRQWLFACDKNDAFIKSIMDTSKLTKARLQKMQDKNLEALQSFQSRKVNGMNLSKRVWNYTDQYKDQIEQALDVGLGEGRSAQELARDVKQNLKDPNRLYRRVRDKRGNLVLSKNAKAFHPGRGVYRSSVKNARRLTRSEINMAYRESDFQRWQELDFVVGFEVKRSNHKPLCECDVCKKLAGVYPREFKFKGWHPQCMCYAVPILMDDDTYNENELGDLKAALRGTTYTHKAAKNAVNDVPQGFKDWVEEHKDLQDNWKSVPYFITDNFVNGKLSDGLMFQQQKADDAPKIDPIQQELDCLMPEITIARQQAAKWGLFVLLSMLDKYVAEKNIEKVKSYISTIFQKVNELVAADADIRQKCRYWGLNTYVLDKEMQNPNAANIMKAMTDLETRVFETKEEYEKYISDAQDAINEAKNIKIDCSGVEADLLAVKADVRDWIMSKATMKQRLEDLKKKLHPAHPAILSEYKTNKEVEETFKTINAEFSTEKWFEHGDLKLAINNSPRSNASTNMLGKISLNPDRLDNVKKALSKIGSGNSNDITFEEADAMATFWHEITHNRNIQGNIYLNATQIRFMELANEWVARHSLPEFYEKMGVETMPHPEFMINRMSTGYNSMVTNYDYVINRLGLDYDKVMATVRKHLFKEMYTDQKTGLGQGLLDGGLSYILAHKPNGKINKVTQKDLEALIDLIRTQEDDEYDWDTGKYINKETVIERWLINHGFIDNN